MNAQQPGTSDSEPVLTALVLAHCWSAYALGQGREGAEAAHERTSAMLWTMPQDVLLASRAPLALLRADVLSSYARYVSRLSGGAVGGSGAASCSASSASSSSIASSASSAGPGSGAGRGGGPHQAVAPHSRDIVAAAAVLHNILCVVDHLRPGPEAILAMAGHSDGGASGSSRSSGSSSAPGSQQSSSEPPAQQQQRQLAAELLDALGRSQLLEHAAAAVLRLAAACPPPPTPTPTRTAGAAAVALAAGTVPPRRPPTSETQTATAAAAAVAEAAPHPWLNVSKAAIALCSCLQILLLLAVIGKREDMSQQPNGTTAASSPASSGVPDNSRLIATQAKRLASGPCTQYFALWAAGCARASIELLASADAGGAAAVGAVGSGAGGGAAGAEAFDASRQSPPPSPLPRREVPTTGTAGLAPLPLPFAAPNPADAALNAAGAVFTFLRVFQATVGVGGGPRAARSQQLHQPAQHQHHHHHHQQQQPMRCRPGIKTPYPAVAVYAFLERHFDAFWTRHSSQNAPIALPLTTLWTPLMQTLLSQLTPEQAVVRLPGLWRLLVMQLGGAKIEAPTAGQVFQLLKHSRVHPAGSPPPSPQPQAPAVADAATAANTSDSWPSLSARCALDAGLLPALERALRRPQLWPNAADCGGPAEPSNSNSSRGSGTDDGTRRSAEAAAVLDLMARGLRRSGAWPAFVAYAHVHEVVGLVATVELVLKRTCRGTAWLRCLPPAFNQAVPEDARLLSNTIVSLLEQLVAVCGADVLEPRPPPPQQLQQQPQPRPPPPPQQQQPPQQRQQPQQPQPLPLPTSRLLTLLSHGRRALVKIIRSSEFPLLVLMPSILVVYCILAFLERLLLLVALSEQQPDGWASTAAETAAARSQQQLQLQQPEPSATPAGSTEKHDDEVAMAAAAETVAGRENSTSSARGENQVDRRSGAASRRPQQPSSVLVGCSTSSMEECDDVAAMVGPLWYNNIDQQRSRDRMRLADLVAAGGAPPAGSAAAAQQALLASFALQRWLPLLLEHASCAAFVAPPGVPVPVINGLSWTLAHRLAVVRLLSCLVGHVPDCMAARDEAQDAEEASAARLASESWHAALWGPCRTSTYGLVRNVLEGPAGPDDTGWPRGKPGEELELACLHLVEALIASRLWVPRPEAALSSGSDGGSNDRLVQKLRLLADRHGRHRLVDHLDATGQALEAQARSAAGLGMSGTEDNSPVMEGLFNVDPQQPRPALQQQMRAGSRLSWLLSPAEVEARLRKAGVVVKGGGSHDASSSGGSGGAAAAPAGAGAFKLCGNPECSSLDGPSALIAPGRGKTCARCRRITYCCGVCQLSHWREGGHDKACAGLAAAGAGAAAAAGAGAAAAAGAGAAAAGSK